ncbi:hypothetical protein [Candidatus Chromulinivorax destructor]|uniref:DUF1090 family protein n=1 Tax=Candidatus Chromulinivorax destructor TaxID=2066483 RepID=A0A345ZBN3_9BACT|nr:hypothetical protein [Candidatus Chromulinivorax destructor]AXK60700.1 hypothetical protein C0J27_03010 [Candidatus Chromulinivorax destructor]
MKKNLYAMLLVVAVGSIANVQAGCSSCKKTTVQVSSDSGKVSSSTAEYKDRMHNIEECIKSVKDKALGKKKSASLAELTTIEAKVDDFAQDTFRDANDKFNMHAKHVRKLRSELKHAREYVKKNGIN